MEFAKFQIKMARIKRHDLQQFCIFTWHLREFWVHTFFPERFFTWQSFAAKLGGTCTWRSRAGGRNAARVAQAWGRSRFAKPGGPGIYAKSRPLNAKLCKLQSLNAKSLDSIF